MPHKPDATFNICQLRSVFATVRTQSFGAGHFQDLIDFLTEQKSNTVVEPISDVTQLRLQADGSVAETGYRFNPIGFSSVSSALATGLNSVFNQLAGETDYRHASGEAAANVPAAAAVFNTVLQANFGRVQERSLLIDINSGTIEGFLGIDHKLLTNDVFLELVVRELEAARANTAEFYRAEIIGRDIRLYYTDAENKWDYVHRGVAHRVGGGWYFSNREDSGTAIRAATALFTRFGPGVLDQKGKNHVRHSGADLIGRASLLINRVVNSAFYGRDIVEEALSRLSSRRLYRASTDSFDDVVSFWVDFLTRQKVPKDDARNIVRNALVVGADTNSPAQLTRYDHQELLQRTCYDLFCGVLRYARTQYHTTRDLLQKVALDILLTSVLKKESLEGINGQETSHSKRRYS